MVRLALWAFIEHFSSFCWNVLKLSMGGHICIQVTKHKLNAKKDATQHGKASNVSIYWKCKLIFIEMWPKKAWGANLSPWGAIFAFMWPNPNRMLANMRRLAMWAFIENFSSFCWNVVKLSRGGQPGPLGGHICIAVTKPKLNASQNEKASSTSIYWKVQLFLLKCGQIEHGGPTWASGGPYLHSCEQTQIEW